jgi:proline iminopeptidase
VPGFRAADGTELACRVQGTGPPVVCLAGGPMRDAAYLGELGGLSARRQLIVPDQRGTGRSGTPADLASCRCDRLAVDVEALREHLGRDQLDLLGHSAGASIAVHYAARYPRRVRRLALVTPSTRAIGIPATVAERRAVLRLRRREPRFAEQAAAFERIYTGRERAGDWAVLAPLTYGRWDEAAQRHHAAGEEQRNPGAARAFAAGVFDAAATRAALAGFSAPVLLLAGELDFLTPVSRVSAEFGSLFPAARLAVQPGAGHYPWLDDPAAFTALAGDFLAS